MHTNFETKANSQKAPANTLAIAALQKTYSTVAGSRTVIDGLNLEVSDGEILAVVGPSGCGKSTLLRLIGGLEKPTSGEISINAESVDAHSDSVAVAFQEPRLFPWRTIAQNVAIGLPKGLSAKVAKERVAELLDLVGLSHASEQRPSEVSGGMAQRASLARALARKPKILLLDEPFGALDALTRLKMHDLLLQIHSSRPTTIILVTHDVEEAVYLADRVLMLRNLHAAGLEADEPRAKILALGSSSGMGAAGLSSSVTQAHSETQLQQIKRTSIQRLVTVPENRPRNRAAKSFTELRYSLLTGLGVGTNI